MSLPVAILIIVALIAGNAFFVALEFALVACDRSKIEALANTGKWPAKAAVKTLKKLSFHLSGAQLGITVTSLVLGFLIDSVVRDLLSPITSRVSFLDGPTSSVLFALLIATIFQLLAGELIPKNVAIAKPEVVAQALSPIANVVHGLLKPFIVMFNGAANWIVRKIGLEPKEELEDVVSLEDLEYLAESKDDSGALSPETKTLLAKTIKFGGKTAADALTPRVHVYSVESNASLNDFLNLAGAKGHSKFPVINGDLDTVVGCIDVASIFSVPIQQRAGMKVSQVMSEPLIIPETKELIDILDDFQSTDTNIVLVNDEHGGTAGVLTLEDILEEIIGEIDDEYDEGRYLTLGAQPGTYHLDGTLHPDEVAEICDFQTPIGEYETIAGFVLSELGRVPEVGDTFLLDGWQIQVVEMDKLRIATIQLVQPSAGDIDV